MAQTLANQQRTNVKTGSLYRIALNSNINENEVQEHYWKVKLPPLKPVPDQLKNYFTNIEHKQPTENIQYNNIKDKIAIKRQKEKRIK